MDRDVDNGLSFNVVRNVKMESDASQGPPLAIDHGSGSVSRSYTDVMSINRLHGPCIV